MAVSKRFGGPPKETIYPAPQVLSISLRRRPFQRSGRGLPNITLKAVGSSLRVTDSGFESGAERNANRITWSAAA